jgi:hypothetical protein
MRSNKLVVGMLELMLLIILFVIVITSIMLISGHAEYAVERFVWGVLSLVVLLIVKCLIEMAIYKSKQKRKNNRY